MEQNFITSAKKFFQDRWIEVWTVRTAAILTAIMAGVNLLSAVTPALTYRFNIISEFLPLVVRRSGRLSAALAGFALLLLAEKLWHRKRVAWLLTVIVLMISAISHLIKGLDYEEAILAIILTIWLLIAHSHFHAHSDQPSIHQAIKTVFWALLFTIIYGVTGFYFLDRHFRINFGFWAAVQQTMIMFTEFYDPGLEPITQFGRYFAGSIYFIGATTIGYALLKLVRPVFIDKPADDSERKKAQSLIEKYGKTVLAHFALLPDKQYFFSSKETIIAYVTKGRIALVLGDPIGPASDCHLTIQEFISFCARNDWQPVFYQTLPDYLTQYQKVGLKNICIGHEAIVDLAKFNLEGKDGKALRTPLNRLTKLGYYYQIHTPPLQEELISQLAVISNEWLSSVHGTEKRFSLGWFDLNYIQHSRVITIHTPDGTINAFANIVPEYQKNEVSIDLMRRRQYAEPGTMEFLFISLFEWARKEGYQTFNLGFCALAEVGKEVDDPPMEKALSYIFEHLNQYYNFKGLYAFKMKFHPNLEPRYLVFPSPISLPTVLTALIRADSGDDFFWKYLKHMR